MVAMSAAGKPKGHGPGKQIKPGANTKGFGSAKKGGKK